MSHNVRKWCQWVKSIKGSNLLIIVLSFTVAIFVFQWINDLTFNNLLPGSDDEVISVDTSQGESNLKGLKLTSKSDHDSNKNRITSHPNNNLKNHQLKSSQIFEANEGRRRTSSKIKYGLTDAYLKSCGDVCNIRMVGRPAEYYPYIEKRFICPALLKQFNVTTVLKEWPPPRQPPPELYDQYTMYGAMPIDPVHYYFAERWDYTKISRIPITENEIAISTNLRARRKMVSTYGTVSEDILQEAINRHVEAVENKIGLDFGSSFNRWITTLALLNGAAKIYMIDYHPPPSEHPRIKTFTPSAYYAKWNSATKSHKVPTHQTGPKSQENVQPLRFRRSFDHNDSSLINTVKLHDSSAHAVDADDIILQQFYDRFETQFDFVVSFSSIEHSGLGRFGDALNPFADLEAAAQLWCLLKPGGLLFLNVPYAYPSGEPILRSPPEDSKTTTNVGPGGSIVWNAHRIYGYARMQHLTANFEVIDLVDVCQMTGDGPVKRLRLKRFSC